MTQATANPITSERFAKGKTFREYVESGIRNKELFEQNYNGLVIAPEQATKLKALAAKPGGPDHIVVIGEDWCPDVYRGLGVAQKIAEAMGIELRMFERDQNKDMIQPYLKDGQFESIPVYVFYNKDDKELGHFIERPKLANEQLHVTRDVLGDVSPEAIKGRLGHEPTEAEITAERANARDKYLAWQRDSEIWAGWRTAAVDEIIELLS